jgi:hypothetical protein
MDHPEACIYEIRYAPCCARGAGTAVMVRAACSFVLQRYDHVRQFELNDTSEVVGLRRMFPLAELSLCTSGKTWFERMFGAQLESNHDLYRELVADTLLSQECKAGLDLTSRICCHRRDAFDRAPTLMLFFASLPRDALTVPWVEELVDGLLHRLHRSQPWIIKAENFSPQGEAEAIGFGPPVDEWVRMRPPGYMSMVFPMEVLDD